MQSLTLFDYPLSSASYRVRIALAFKGIDFVSVPINLRNGDQRSKHYLAQNPAGLVPALQLPSGQLLTQSLAILRYLDSLVATPRMFPTHPVEDALVSALALDIACDIHPLNNLRVLNYLTGPLALEERAKNDWYAHWITAGFGGLETTINAHGGSFCAGDSISAADICLVPQMFNARRFNVDLSAFPRLVDIDARLTAIPEIAKVAPNLPQA
jgi:maleylacetoacetate isomerase